jgi:hypothetical protein
MRNEMLITCQWFYGCGKVTNLGTMHPQLGIIPVCEMCAKFADIEPEFVLEIVR